MEQHYRDFEEQRRRDIHDYDEIDGRSQHELISISSHQTERVSTSDEFNFHVNLVKQVSILEEYIGMNSTNHVDNMTASCESRSTPKAYIACCLGKVHHSHPSELSFEK